jgi:hypothetical protein
MLKPPLHFRNPLYGEERQPGIADLGGYAALPVPKRDRLIESEVALRFFCHSPVGQYTRVAETA